MGATNAEMKKLVARCKAAGWTVRPAARGVIVRPPKPRTGQVVIPPKSHGRGLQNVERELARLGLKDDLATAFAQAESHRQKRLKEARASANYLDTSTEAENESMPTTTPSAASPTSSRDAASGAIPYRVVEPFVTGDFQVPMKITRRANGTALNQTVYYKNMLGLRIKPSDGIPTAPDGTRVLCLGKDCDLTFVTPEAARWHIGDKHPSAATIRRRELRLATVTRLRDVKAQIVGEFDVEMKLPRKGGGQPMYYQRLRGVRLSNGRSLIVCNATDWCDWATDDVSLARGHLNKGHKDGPPKESQPRQASGSPPVAAPASAKAAIAKVASAPARSEAAPAPAPAVDVGQPTVASPFAPQSATSSSTPKPAAAGAATAPNEVTSSPDLSSVMFANPDVVSWDHEDELSALTDTIATLQKSRELLLQKLYRMESDRDQVREEIRAELVAEFREREEALRRQLLAAQEDAEAARRKAKENEAAVAQLAEMKRGLTAFQGALGGLGNLLQSQNT